MENICQLNLEEIYKKTEEILVELRSILDGGLLEHIENLDEFADIMRRCYNSVHYAAYKTFKDNEINAMVKKEKLIDRLKQEEKVVYLWLPKETKNGL